MSASWVMKISMGPPFNRSFERGFGVSDRIGRSVPGEAGEVRQLERMRIDRRVPLVDQRVDAAHVIEVAVRQQDCGGRHAGAESIGRCIAKRLCRSA